MEKYIVKQHNDYFYRNYFILLFLLIVVTKTINDNINDNNSNSQAKVPNCEEQKPWI